MCVHCYSNCQGCNQLFGLHQFVIKNGVGRWVEAKKFGIFVKNICLLPVGYLTCSAKQMLFQPPMYQQNKVEGVCFYPVICVYIYLYYLYVYVCLYFIYLYLFTNAWTIRDSEGIGVLFGAHRKTGHFACSHCQSRCYF